MKLYKISQTVNDNNDTFDSAVVVSDTEENARLIHPDSSHIWNSNLNSWADWGSGSWVPPDKVQVEYIGIAKHDLRPGTVICASYRSG